MGKNINYLENLLRKMLSSDLVAPGLIVNDDKKPHKSVLFFIIVIYLWRKGEA